MRTNKLTIFLTAASLLTAAIGLIFRVIDIGGEASDEVIEIAFGTGGILGLYLLISNGTIMNTIYWRLILRFLVVTLVGVVFKIMHYAYADLILTVGLSSMALTYLVRFIKKDKKARLDFFKLLWVVSASISCILIILHYIPRDYAILSTIIFWITVVDFALMELTGKINN
jgi:hypothetical protein